ncbi:MAG TPA: MBOAT family protein, partial [Polyangiaceae bacterium]|nr:MBOAT family protein [Polyangiaceae bacterium]
MLFNSVQFGVFFAMVLVGFVASPRRYRTSVLLGASLSFYALWVPAYLVLLLGTLSVNFLLTKRMSRSPHPRRYLVASVAITLSLLAVFKYAAFGVELATPFVRRALDTSPRIPELVLPLGISFYSFEIVSLSVDVYRGRRPCPSFARYLLFVTFFPHLIAGPIMRGGELLPQLDAGGERTPERTRRGLWLFFTGLAKKTVFADFLLS